MNGFGASGTAGLPGNICCLWAVECEEETLACCAGASCSCGNVSAPLWAAGVLWPESAAPQEEAVVSSAQTDAGKSPDVPVVIAWRLRKNWVMVGRLIRSCG